MLPVQVLSSLGQSSMLHLRGGLVDPRRISRALQALQVSGKEAKVGLHSRDRVMATGALAITACARTSCAFFGAGHMQWR